MKESIKAVNMKLILILILCIHVINSETPIVEGCSSHCSPLFDDNLDCFNNTLKYYEQTLFGIMRAFISSEVNVANSRRNSVPYTRNDLIQQTINIMNTVKTPNVEDENQVLTVDQAKPIVEALVDNTLSQLAKSKAFIATECPLACEVKKVPFDIIFYISLALNIALFLVGIASLIIRARKESVLSNMKTEVMVTKEELKAYKKLKKEKLAME